MIGTRRALLAVCALALVSLGTSAPALAAAPAPGWSIESLATPTSFSASDNANCAESSAFEGCDAYHVTVRNAGAAVSSGPVTLTDELPEGVTVQRVALFASPFTIAGSEPDLGTFLCTSASPVKCDYPGPFKGALPEAFAPDETLKLVIYVKVNEGAAAGPLVNSATVAGGGAPSASTDSTNQLGPVPAEFGFSRFDFAVNGLDGTRDTQAGDHPYELTTTIGLNSARRLTPDGVFGPTSTEDVRDVVTDLPLGFVGSILATPQCTFAQLSSRGAEGNGHAGGCPQDTIVGHILTEPSGTASVNAPIYNMTPERGVPAEFGYVDNLAGPHVFYVRVVPSPKGYVLQATNPEVPQIPLTNIVVTFYGNPAEKDKTGNAPIPLFTNPTNCNGEEPTATIYIDSWAHPAKFNSDGTPANLDEPAWRKIESRSPPITGCNALQFSPGVAAQPTTHEADEPTGLEFEIKAPQSETAGVLATPTLRKAVVRLPEGLTVDPSAGDGLAACSEAEIGWLGGTDQNFDSAAPMCPEAAKIGSLELESPLLAHPLEGAVFLASQNENPFHSTLAAYIVVDDPATGVLVKIPGELSADAHTGRLTAVFDENPNLPFSDLKLHFFGGPRAALATPADCGTFTTSSELTPWSAPDSGLPATPFDSFVINSGCQAGFKPAFVALSANVQAGSYTTFQASLSRSDTDQALAGLELTLPPGLLAKVAGVPLCPDANADAGSCPEASRVGRVLASAGPGPNPLQVAGKAYLTGPYNGGPYGLAIVVPAVAGPYDFGTVVVRQSLRIDPHTAQVSDVSDPFPTIVDGIPLRLRRVDVTLDRSEFAFNPTSCNKLAFAGTILGTPFGAPTVLNGALAYSTQPGLGSSLTAPFQVTNCRRLAFQPKFSATTSGKTSKANGASLAVKLAYPKGALGTQADVARTKVVLPKQLPSRLTTLQRACTNAQFEADPMKCPQESKVGTAVVHTPILPLPLEGPAIFVSHGGEAFPSLTMVLKGNGVTIDLVGSTFISRAGVTSTTFKSLPDAPFSTFELKLPLGRFSALAANGSLCKAARKLKMPTELVAQSGATIHRITKIKVTGCHKVKGHKARHHRRRGGKSRTKK
jgi:uncharacterized repeat protein (TIGR01451 family)